MASRIENGIEMVRREEVASALENVAREAWNTWGQSEPVSYHPVNRSNELLRYGSAISGIIETGGGVILFLGVHAFYNGWRMDSQTIVAAGLILAVPAIKNISLDVINRVINKFRSPGG